MPADNEPEGRSPARDPSETQQHGGEPDGPDRRRPIHDSETIIGGAGAYQAAPATAAGAGPGADLAEFQRALVDIGLIDDEEIKTYSAGLSPAEGVLGLARALERDGKLTAYQAAALYQRKSRGLLIGNYLILDKLGQGGMGVVFKARHRRLGRVGALKILPPSFARDRTAVMRFRREVEAAGRLKHPNLVAALDADEDRGVHFLVMDYVEGNDLDKVVRERGRMPVLQAIDCLIQAARGLEAAHGQGIVHRDIKPGNLMLDTEGIVRVLDLGLARIVDAANPFGQAAGKRLTESGMYMGTIDYMAPEQAENSHRVDRRADVYSLGCTLHYLLTGREPFPGETVLKRLMAHQERPVPSLRALRPDVSPKLDATFQKMLAKRPDDRPASMTEVIALLESARSSAHDVKEPRVDASKPRPELMVFNEVPLKRALPPKTDRDPSIFARAPEPEGLRITHELNLEDLVMDVRPEVAPTPLPRAAKPAAQPAQALKRPGLKAVSRQSRRSTAVMVALASIVVLGAAIVGIAFFRSPAPIPEDSSSKAETHLVADRDGRGLKVTPPPPPRLVTKTIFDGTSGLGWMLCDRRPVPRGNVQPDGLNPRGLDSYLVVYEQKLGDFVLDFDYKLTKGCNSGVFLRVSDLKNPINTGIEVALDETRRGDERDSGGFYSLVAPRVFAQQPAGTWNHMTITAAGPRIAVVLNDTEVSTINLDEWTIPGKRPDGTDHNFKNVAIASLARSGYMGFQNMGGDCWFKNVILNKPASSVVPSLGDTVADTSSPPSANTPAPKAPAPTTPAPAAPAPKPAAPTTPAPSPRWVILGGGNHYFARNIPDEAYKTLGDLDKERTQLKSITFAPGGGWVILHGRNGYFARNIPDEAYKTLGELAKRGEELKSITFAPGGGWTILFGRSGNLSRNIPDEALRMLASLSKRGAELKSIAFAPGGGWTILHSRNGHFARNIPDEAFKTLHDLAERGEDLKSITFVPGGGWTILFGPSGYFARNLPDEAFKTLGTVGSQGELKSLSFVPRALIRLSQDDQETRDQVLERMARLKVPGLSIALVNRFQVEWARGYGVVRAGGSEAVTAQTRFQAASLSKPVTAVAALRLVQQGKLDLDQALNEKLVSWKVSDNELTKRKQPTLRQVLDHSAGFSVHGFGGYPAGGKLPTLVQVLDGTAPANSVPIRVVFFPGSKSQYSGGGYTVLQQLMIDVTKKPFPALMRELVLDPIAMKDSTFQQPPPGGFDAVAAVAHIDGRALPSLWHVYPEMAAAGLWTTPSDLARFVIALQRAKRKDTDSILSPRLIGEMLRKQIGEVGLGVFLSGADKSAAFGHTGGNAGFECEFIGFAEAGQGAVLMTNAQGGGALIKEMLESLRAEYAWPG